MAVEPGTYGGLELAVEYVVEVEVLDDDVVVVVVVDGMLVLLLLLLASAAGELLPVLLLLFELLLTEALRCTVLLETEFEEVFVVNVVEFESPLDAVVAADILL